MMEDTFGARVGTEDPNTLFKSFFAGDKLGDFRKVRRILGRDPDTLAEFDQAFNHHARDIMAPFDDARGRRVVDLKSMTEFLESDLMPHAKEVNGAKWAENVDLLTELVFRRENKPVESVTDLARAFRLNAGLQGLGKFLRIPFPPLTVKGRALTAVVGAASEATMREISQALASPEALKRLIQLEKAPLSGIRARTVFGGVFTTLLAILDQADKKLDEPVRVNSPTQDRSSSKRQVSRPRPGNPNNPFNL